MEMRMPDGSLEADFWVLFRSTVTDCLKAAPIT
jgi:hypothetical protein